MPRPMAATVLTPLIRRCSPGDRESGCGDSRSMLSFAASSRAISTNAGARNRRRERSEPTTASSSPLRPSTRPCTPRNVCCDEIHASSCEPIARTAVLTGAAMRVGAGSWRR